jgi:hypothetical protein
MKFDGVLKKLVFDNEEEILDWQKGLESIDENAFINGAKDALEISLFDLFLQDKDVGFCIITSNIKSLQDDYFYSIKTSFTSCDLPDGHFIVTKKDIYGE